MSSFFNGFTLSHRIAVYIPSTFDINNTVDTSAYIERVARAFANYFGGATSSKAVGYWSSPICGLVGENITIVYAFATSDDIEKHGADVMQLVDDIKHELKQEAVSLEYDGALILV